MRYGSVCSGIEAATVAWHSLGWRPAWFSEIDKFPSAVLAHHYPTVKNHGDFTKITESEPIDLLVGGTPCQSFSVAGLRKGLDDDRGQLTLEFCKLASRLNPKWIVWENVPGVLSQDGGRAFGSFLGALDELGYGFAYRILDAQNFGVPQRRRRVFVVGCFRDWRSPAEVLFESESVCGDIKKGREKRKDVAPTISARTEGGGGLGTDFDLDAGLIAKCLNAKGGAGRIDAESETFIPVGLSGEMNATVGKIGALDAGSKSGGGQPSMVFSCPSSAVRRLTPRECERLQGFPDDYTLIPYRNKSAADGPRYKALGNSMAVPVMHWLGQRINNLKHNNMV